MKSVLGYDVAPHHQEWAKLLEQKRLVIQSARDHGKTTFFSVSYPLWKMATTPNFHACVISYAEDQSKRILRELRLKLEQTEIFQSMIPTRWKPGSWGKTEIHLLNRSYTHAKSFGSSMRGGHYDLIIVDDPLKDRSSMPLEQQQEIFFGVISPAVKPNGQMIVVGTPVRFGDLFDILDSNKMYTCSKFPAIKSDGNPLWPERYDLKRLEEKKEELMQYWLFAREYLLERIDPENAPFKQAWFQNYKIAPEKLSLLMSVDPAISFEGDYTAIVVTGTDLESNVYVLGYKRLKTGNVSEIVNSILGMAKQFGVTRVIIEALGFQRLIKHWLVQEMEKTGYWLSIHEIKFQKTSKSQRILTLQPKIEMGKLLMRDGQTELLSEFVSFPKGTYDDLIDALSMQVGHWITPDIDRPRPPVGSFQDIMDQRIKNQNGVFTKLFQDLVYEEPQSSIVLK